MAECAPGSAGCVEFTYDFGPNIHHELRHCVDRAAAAAPEAVVGPRDLIPVAAFDDEVYAKGCLKGRDLCAMFCLTETDYMYDFSSERGGLWTYK